MGEARGQHGRKVVRAAERVHKLLEKARRELEKLGPLAYRTKGQTLVSEVKVSIDALMDRTVQISSTPPVMLDAVLPEGEAWGDDGYGLTEGE